MSDIHYRLANTEHLLREVIRTIESSSTIHQLTCTLNRKGIECKMTPTREAYDDDGNEDLSKEELRCKIVSLEEANSVFVRWNDELVHQIKQLKGETR